MTAPTSLRDELDRLEQRITALRAHAANTHQATAPEFWPGFAVDPVTDDIYRSAAHRTDRLPKTALEFLDRLREVGYRIAKGEDLDLQDPDGPVGVEPLDRDTLQVGPIGVGQCAHVSLSIQCPVNVDGHEVSSRCEAVAAADDHTVGGATDMVAGPAGTLGPAGPQSSEDLAVRRRPWWLRLRDQLVSAIVVADPEPTYSALDRADGLRDRQATS